MYAQCATSTATSEVPQKGRHCSSNAHVETRRQTARHHPARPGSPRPLPWWSSGWHAPTRRDGVARDCPQLTMHVQRLAALSASPEDVSEAFVAWALMTRCIDIVSPSVTLASFKALSSARNRPW